MSLSGSRIHITGIVQGVGFRPFVYNRAKALSLKGWVRNTSAGVDIEIEGEQQAVELFINTLTAEAPTLSKIDSVKVEWYLPVGYERFEIVHSESVSHAFQPISPDVCICPDCLRELFDSSDRRYRYPFINCTNCGPRFTIIKDIPYDRPNTTMASFPLCPQCEAEYLDPSNRRFHAQPVACPECGPHIWLEKVNRAGQYITSSERDEALMETQKLLADGKIIAIKGLGGFHLACDAANPAAVAELRKRKLRVDKPFALMMPDLAVVQQHCEVDEFSRNFLESRECPIVLLPRKASSNLASGVAPMQTTLGVMLPYTPLHYLLFTSQTPSCLVMTSGNLSEEPIATDNQEARERLATLADAFLMHNRPIHNRCDDSVIRCSPEIKPLDHKNNYQPIYTLRRSRGYAPMPVNLPFEAPPLLATGAELKNTFCLTNGRYAFLSQYIGDMENFETLTSFEKSIALLEKTFRVQPKIIAYDLHPDYLSTHYALTRANCEGIPSIGIQHHHAHIAACMAEHGFEKNRPVIGVAFDGTGLGDDGNIWGSEFLLANYDRYNRYHHLTYQPLPGGDAATRKPARIALAYLWAAGIEWDPNLPSVDSLSAEERLVLQNQLTHRVNTPKTSSMGRLFDAVSALVGVCQTVNYEAQAAIELESICDPQEQGYYTFGPGDQHAIPLDALLQSIVSDIRERTPASIISARFHNGLAEMVTQTVIEIKNDTGISDIVLSGGVWQNITLLSKTLTRLEHLHFTVHIHHQVPTNDGGISLGQAVVAAYKYLA